MDRLDGVFAAALQGAVTSRLDVSPPRLAAAMRHAVLTDGKRLRPQLLLRVAMATAGHCPQAALDAAVALELLHCASLVHDDLPCFDDAAERRGRPTVQRAFGAPTAVLAGDALIVLAFEVVAGEPTASRTRLAIVRTLAGAVGACGGLAAGQACEFETEPVDLASYHRCKTGSLFAAAVEIGALVGGASPQSWTAVGDELGQAYQLADDLVDAVGHPGQFGKPTRQDERHGRPNAAQAFGLSEAFARVKQHLYRAIAAVPACSGGDDLRAWLVHTAAELYTRHRGPVLADALRRGEGELVRATGDTAALAGKVTGGD